MKYCPISPTIVQGATFVNRPSTHGQSVTTASEMLTKYHKLRYSVGNKKPSKIKHIGSIRGKAPVEEG